MQAIGLLILRLGIGTMFMYHGYGKFAGGTEMWAKIGGAMSFLGVSSHPEIFGFLAALSEFGGGLCLILGFLVRLVWYGSQIVSSVRAIENSFSSHVHDDNEFHKGIETRLARHSDTFDDLKEIAANFNTRLSIVENRK